MDMKTGRFQEGSDYEVETTTEMHRRFGLNDLPWLWNIRLLKVSIATIDDTARPDIVERFSRQTYIKKPQFKRAELQWKATLRTQEVKARRMQLLAVFWFIALLLCASAIAYRSLSGLIPDIRLGSFSVTWIWIAYIIMGLIVAVMGFFTPHLYERWKVEGGVSDWVDLIHFATQFIMLFSYACLCNVVASANLSQLDSIGQFEAYITVAITNPFVGRYNIYMQFLQSVRMLSLGPILTNLLFLSSLISISLWKFITLTIISVICLFGPFVIAHVRLAKAVDSITTLHNSASLKYWLGTLERTELYQIGTLTISFIAFIFPLLYYGRLLKGIASLFVIFNDDLRVSNDTTARDDSMGNSLSQSEDDLVDSILARLRGSVLITDNDIEAHYPDVAAKRDARKSTWQNSPFMDEDDNRETEELHNRYIECCSILEAPEELLNVFMNKKNIEVLVKKGTFADTSMSTKTMTMAIGTYESESTTPHPVFTRKEYVPIEVTQKARAEVKIQKVSESSQLEDFGVNQNIALNDLHKKNPNIAYEGMGYLLESVIMSGVDKAVISCFAYRVFKKHCGNTFSNAEHAVKTGHSAIIMGNLLFGTGNALWNNVVKTRLLVASFSHCMGRPIERFPRDDLFTTLYGAFSSFVPEDISLFHLFHILNRPESNVFGPDDDWNVSKHFISHWIKATSGNTSPTMVRRIRGRNASELATPQLFFPVIDAIVFLAANEFCCNPWRYHEEAMNRYMMEK
eukprot:GHVH01007862.1.p1 GENE.GHVH01007862.1~~GHVH01007862.1.p1  ORF type:complete len:743 (+),score=99.27 GHVH01007862.1:886-3114(+)